MPLQKRSKIVAGSVSALLAIGLGAALTLHGSDDLAVRAGAASTAATLPGDATALTSTTTTAATEPPTTTITVAWMTTTTQSASTVTQPSTTTATRGVTTTTLPRATSTTRPAARTFDLSSAPGPFYTEVTASGANCLGTDAGVTLEISDPAGQPFNGNGGAALPDGTWKIPLRFRNDSTGRYSVHATCINSTTNAVTFQYADASVTLG
jgi:hypothetical protein